ncbi:MAG: tetratricopeptide repeat protein [Bacteroidia bacterium]|nr:tetratricopeptide repeat protein [Bacteroidia bacterium]NND25842.1 tetratricopeptide repeat protein [Flavobacteriaceae bacterium]NNK60959.1 tetratricopeptide repeat protein [Flavobacteriaceae bacterium]NNL31622.1 tetratricopeptide repeat protein [Flavobacteriaceae bacterium]RZW48592.1 MAG: tetratricopeptide repeat protein [Flavobacteriaceae bacterium]
MKKHVVMGLAMLIGSFTFAQKSEVKAAEKAIKNNDFSGAKSALSTAESMMSSMDDKTKAKFYYLKGQALYANGTGSDSDISEALKSFDMLMQTEEKSGRKTYSPQADAMKVSMSNAFLDKAQTALNRKDHATSSINFERAYNTSPQDTLYLFNAALLATSSKNYDEAIRMYKQLMDMGYTGISMEYRATDIETGEEQNFPSASLRDISVKAGTHEKSRNVTTESKVGEMAKNIALIYIEQGKNDMALKAIEDAKKSNPNDFNLLLSEANVRYQLGEMDTYRELISKALEVEPNNADLLFNLGVVSGDQGEYEEARSYYDKAIEVDNDYVRAYMNSAALILDREQGIIDEMNSLGTSAADDKKYSQLQEDRLNLYREAIPYLESALDRDKNNINAAKTLVNIYSVLGETDKMNAMKAKVASIEGQN